MKNLKKIETDYSYALWKLVGQTVFQSSFLLFVKFDILLGRNLFDTKLWLCHLQVIRPFYSCVLSALAFKLKRGWRWPCFVTNLLVFHIKLIMFTGLLAWEYHDLHMKLSRKVCNKTRSLPASLLFKGQGTENTTVKWPISKVPWRLRTHNWH